MATINVAGYEFSGPFFHTRPFQKDFSCVYVIMNSLNKVIDVGQTQSVNNRIIDHERKSCWYRYGCNESGLYILRIEPESQRLIIERLIRNTYFPPCGDR